MKMCAGLARVANSVELVNFSSVKRSARKASLLKFYAIKEMFSIKLVPTFRQLTPVNFILSTFFELLPTWLHLRSSNPDLVLGRHLPSIFYAALLGFPVVFETHYPIWESRLYSRMFNCLIRNRNLRHVVVITEALKREYLSKYPFLRPNLFLVLADASDPIDFGKVKPSRLRGTDTLQNGLNIGYAGSLYQGKGLELILVLSKLLPEDNFHVFGGDKNVIEPYQNSSHTTAHQNLFFYGFVSQHALDNFIASFDICLLPIQKTMYGTPTAGRVTKNLSPFTSPMKLFQYMAHGKAIICSDIPVLREILDESLALFAPPDDSLVWKENIDLLRNAALRERLGERARDRQQERHTWTRRASDLLTAAMTNSG